MYSLPKSLRNSVVLALSFAAVGLAQDRGTIRGLVTDESGSVIPMAVVTARNVATGLTQTATTGQDGLYNILYLPVGDYILTAERPGFRKAEVSNIAVNVNSVVDINIKLIVGAVDQKV